MTNTSTMMRQHPDPHGLDHDVLVACIEACFDCQQVCTSCADACLSEEKVDNLRSCIRLNLDCADLCGATGRLLSRQTAPNWEVVRAQLQALLQSANACGDECEQHAEKHEHCRTCMESCRQCAASCRELLSVLPSA